MSGARYFSLIGKLVKARDAAGLTQVYMARCLGVGRATFWRWETLETRPDAISFLAWADRLGVDLQVADMKRSVDPAGGKP